MGIGAGSSPIGCEGFVKVRKVQGSSLLLSIANNFVGHSYVYIRIYIYIHHILDIIYIYIRISSFMAFVVYQAAQRCRSLRQLCQLRQPGVTTTAPCHGKDVGPGVATRYNIIYLISIL